MREMIDERCIAEDQWSITTRWIKGIKAWWKQWVSQAQKIGKGRGAEGADIAIKYLDEGEKKINQIRDDLWFDKGMWPRNLSGKEKEDRKSDSLLGKKNVAWDLEQASEELYNIRGKVKVWKAAIYDPNSSEARNYPEAVGQKKWGKSGNLDALDAEIESLPEVIKKVDSYISGRLFRRLNALVNKWNPVGDQDSPFDKKIDTEFSLGRMKVMFQPVYGGSKHHSAQVLASNPEFTRDPLKVDFYIKAFDRAQKMMKRSGFGGAWYGVTWVIPKGKARAVKTARTHREFKEGAHYNTSSDDVVFFEGARQSNLDWVARALVHELGHRWYYKFMNRAERARFDSYFGEVASVSDYGSESSVEDFAEVFSWYVTGKKLTKDQRERFKQFALKGGKIRRHEGMDTEKLSQLSEILGRKIGSNARFVLGK